MYEQTTTVSNTLSDEQLVTGYPTPLVVRSER